MLIQSLAIVGGDLQRSRTTGFTIIRVTIWICSMKTIRSMLFYDRFGFWRRRGLWLLSCTLINSVKKISIEDNSKCTTQKRSNPVDLNKIRPVAIALCVITARPWPPFVQSEVCQWELTSVQRDYVKSMERSEAWDLSYPVIVPQSHDNSWTEWPGGIHACTCVCWLKTKTQSARFHFIIHVLWLLSGTLSHYVVWNVRNCWLPTGTSITYM